MRTTRIAILNCEGLVPEVAKIYGPLFSDVFIARLQAASLRLGNPSTLLFSAYNAREEIFPSPDTVDAILITGSISSAYDQDPWVLKLVQYIKQIYEQHHDVRVFGTCFGHQLVAHALLSGSGVVVEPNPRGLQIGIRSVLVDPAYAAFWPLSVRHLQEYKIQVLHGDHVRLPPTPLPVGWMSVGRSECCESHGLYLPRRILTLQGHFEFDEMINSKIIKHHFTPERGYPAKDTKIALASTRGKDDSDLVAELVLDFLIGGDDTRLVVDKDVQIIC